MKKRLAAEWEPIKGVMIAWPAFLPHAYIVDLTQNYHVYLCVPGQDEENNAKKYLTEWGGNIRNVTFCQGPQGFDAPWVRDWGMHPIFDESRNFHLAGAEYQMSTPFVAYENPEVMFDGQNQPLSPNSYEQEENKAQPMIAEQIGQPFKKLPYALTGGNIMSDGFNKMMSMQVILTENRAKGISEEQFYANVARDTGMGDYSIFSNFGDYGLQHIDCYLKMIDEETLLVSRTPKNHKLYQRYEDLLDKEIRKSRTRYGRPFKIFRLDIVPFNEGHDDLTAYVNSVILNNSVYVPMYGIPQDKIALQQWQDVLPGYEIKGFDFEFAKEPEVITNRTGYTRTGWGTEDVAHCRTRAVWDENMLYIAVRRLEEEEPANQVLDIHVNIVDYSKAGLIEGSLKLYYREAGGTEWNCQPLETTNDRELFLGSLMGKPGDTIEYYVAAESKSGRKETMPRVAPKGTYKVHIR